MKISNTKLNYNIVICGTGATGSQLLPFLTQLIAYSESNTLTLIDEDRIELKNCKNQKFLPNDETKFKAEVLARRYKNVYPNLDVTFVPEFIKSVDQLKEIMPTQRYTSTINVVVGCVDNNPTRKIMCEYFKNCNGNLIYIDSGNGTADRIGQVIVSAKLDRAYNTSLLNRTVITTMCPSDFFREIEEDMDTVDKATSCGYNTDANPQNIATNIMAATTIFSVLTNLIQFDDVNPGIIYFDAEKPSITFRPSMTEEEWECHKKS